MAEVSEDVFKRVQKVIMAQLSVPEDQVKIESTFEQDLGADSLDVVELIMQLEEEFGVDIPDEDATKIKTVGDAVSFIQNASPK